MSNNNHEKHTNLNSELFESYMNASTRMKIGHELGADILSRVDQIMLAIFSGQALHVPVLLYQLLVFVKNKKYDSV